MNAGNLPSLVVSTVCVVSSIELVVTGSVVAAEDKLSVEPVDSTEAMVDTANDTPHYNQP